MYRLKKNSLKINQQCIYRYILGSKNYLTISDMPQPASLPFIGTKLEFLVAGGANKLHKYVNSRHEKLGTIFKERLGGNTDLVFISDADLIKTLFLNLEGKYPIHILPEPWVLYEKLYGSQRGLFFMNGEEWLNNRRIMNKLILREGVDSWITGPVEKTIQELVQSWKIKLEKGCPFTDIESELYRLSINVIINILLGPHSLEQSLLYNDMLTLFSDSVKEIFHTTTKLYSAPVNLFQKLNLKVWRDFKKSVDDSLFLAKKITNEMILNSNKSEGLIKRLVDEGMKSEMITRIVGDLIIAAGDTTTYTVLWTLLLLSRNKNILEETRQRDNKYINYVVKESMRLYPVAPFLTRILPHEAFLGDYKLNKGTPIIASIYTTGRNKQYFSEPNSFLPYRWDKADPRRMDLINHVSSATLPFALGARSCVGKKIALKQLTEFISQIINNFDFKCNNDKNVKSVMSQVLVPDQNIDLLISLRK